MPPRYLLSLFVLTFSVSALWSPVLSQAQSQLPYWTEAAPPTVARQELYPEVLNGKIYVVGGLLSPNTGFSAPNRVLRSYQGYMDSIETDT